jgi:hypothetical protein
MTKTELRKIRARRARADQALQDLDDRVQADVQRSGAATLQQNPSNQPNSPSSKPGYWAIPTDVASLPPYTVLQLPQIRFLIRRLNPCLLDLLPYMPLEHIPGLIGCLNEVNVPWDIWALVFSGQRDDPEETWKKFMSYLQTSVSKIQLASKQPTSSESPNALADEQPSDNDDVTHVLAQGPGDIEPDRIVKNDVAGVGQQPGDIELGRIAPNDAADVGGHQPGDMNVANDDPPAYGDGNEVPGPAAEGPRAPRKSFFRSVVLVVAVFLIGFYFGWFTCEWYARRAHKSE